MMRLVIWDDIAPIMTPLLCQYKNETVVRPSYFYNGNTQTWWGHLYIETGPRRFPGEFWQSVSRGVCGWYSSVSSSFSIRIKGSCRATYSYNFWTDDNRVRLVPVNVYVFQFSFQLSGTSFHERQHFVLHFVLGEFRRAANPTKVLYLKSLMHPNLHT